MLPKGFDKSYIYKGTMPKKSGYSTKILVHKEGIMTNEEIYKLSNVSFKIDKKENAIIKRLLFGLCGFVIMLLPVLVDFGKSVYYSDTRYLLCIILALLFSVFLMVVSVKVAMPIETEYRNYFANLVRKDERNRCMTKLERYEHEGSK